MVLQLKQMVAMFKDKYVFSQLLQRKAFHLFESDARDDIGAT